MTVGRICVRTVDLASSDESVQVAAGRMHNRKVGTLVVLDKEERPVGIVTDRDLTVRVLAAARDPLTTTVGDVMTQSPRMVREDTSIEDALAVMRAAPCRRIPVVDGEGCLVGLLSLDDILDLLREEFDAIGRLVRGESPDSLGEEE
ncbi:MAG: CBS domain-containing protein [Planctomycetaceae bacterium]